LTGSPHSRTVRAGNPLRRVSVAAIYRVLRRLAWPTALACLLGSLVLSACGGGADKENAVPGAATTPAIEEAVTARARATGADTSTPSAALPATVAPTTTPPECPVPDVIQQVTEAKPCAVAETTAGGGMDGARVTLNNLLDPYIDASIFQATPAPGMRFVAIEATVQARPGVQHYAKYNNFSLVDTRGNTYQAGLEVGVPGDIFATYYRLTSDKKYHGWVRFEVPVGATLVVLNYDVSGEQIGFRFQ
jgi:hypothetical protein